MNPREILAALPMRRMLFGGGLARGQSGRSLSEGLRRCGWLVEDLHHNAIIAQSREPLARIANRLSRRVVEAAMHDVAGRAADLLRPDVFVTVKGQEFSRRTIQMLNARGILTVNIYPDQDFEACGYDRRRLDDYRMVITTKSYQLDFLRRRHGRERTAFVHHGYDAGYERAISNAPPDYRWDIAFVGNASPAKFDWLLPIAERFPHLKMIVAGNNWPHFAEGSALERSLLGAQVGVDTLCAIIGASKINLAVHHGPQRPGSWADAVSTRTFEIPAAGGFMLHIDSEEVRRLFDADSEVGLFSSSAELVERIERFVDGDSEREAMRRRAHRRCVPAYSAESRAIEIDAVIRRRLEEIRA